MISELEILIEKVKNKQPFIFTKFGDGEYECAAHNYNGANCDGDKFTPNLREGLNRAFVNLVGQGAYIGKWFEPHKVEYWENLVGTKELVNWVHYHTFIVDGTQAEVEKKVELYRLLQNDSRKKLVVCNELIKRSVKLLRADKHIKIPLNGWYDPEKEKIKMEILKHIEDGYEIFFFMGGMGVKSLISELVNESSKDVTYIDIGSGLDLISSKCDSRGFTSYETMKERMRLLIEGVEGWDSAEEDKMYEIIYKESSLRLGIHK